MNDPLLANLAIIIGSLLLLYSFFIIYKTIQYQIRIKKEKTKLLQTEGEKFFRSISKPFMHKIQKGEQLPNRYAALSIDGDLLELQLVRQIRMREINRKKACQLKATKLIQAWYYPNFIKLYVYDEEGVPIAKTNCTNEEFEFRIIHFLKKEYVFESSVSLAKKH